jgi:carboxypeptidase D
MTWHGAQGFQKQPSTPFVVEQEDITWQPVYLDNYGAPNSGPQGVMGISHYERGLMWVETFQSGHEVPMYQPRAALQHLQWMLGHIDNFD